MGKKGTGTKLFGQIKQKCPKPILRTSRFDVFDVGRFALGLLGKNSYLKNKPEPSLNIQIERDNSME